jgi:hypothetical protein
MKVPLSCVTAAGLRGPDRDPGQATATVCLPITFVFRIVLAMAFPSPGSAGPGRVPSGSRGKRHSWRPPRSARSAMLGYSASPVGASRPPSLTHVTSITNSAGRPGTATCAPRRSLRPRVCQSFGWRGTSGRAPRFSVRRATTCREDRARRVQPSPDLGPEPASRPVR